jgi:hypothetical protein
MTVFAMPEKCDTENEEEAKSVVDEMLKSKEKKDKDALFKSLFDQIEKDKKDMQIHLDNAKRYETYAMSVRLVKNPPNEDKSDS